MYVDRSRSTMYPYPSKTVNATNSRSIPSSAAQMASTEVFHMPVSVTQTNRPSAGWANPPVKSTFSNHPVSQIVGVDYNHYSNPHGGVSSTYSSATYPLSPPVPFLQSQRSSLSSVPASEPYSQSDIYPAYYPRIKTEDHPEWPAETSMSYLPTTTEPNCGIPTTSSASFAGGFETALFTVPSEGWPGVDVFPTADSQSLGVDDSLPPGRETRQRRLVKAARRAKAPRKMTTKEDANYQCEVRGCGKLFSRTYNYKAHMETHDAGRVYPFVCEVSGCEKKFVRKTDLQRHHQSVHLKERRHQCDFCNRFFARKDTLRRHMDDGCSKRFDLDVSFNTASRQIEVDPSKIEPKMNRLPPPQPANSGVYGTTPRPTAIPREAELSRSQGILAHNPETQIRPVSHSYAYQ